MFVYFGYFSKGNSLYSIVTECEIPIKFFELKIYNKHLDGAFEPAVCLPYDESLRVFNLKTKNSWYWKGDNTKAFFLCNPFNYSGGYDIYGFLKRQYVSSDDIVSVKDIDNILRNGESYLIQKQSEDRVLRKKEKSNYPDLIIGTDKLKKILSKEFNYVGKIYFEPFPKRDNGIIHS